MDDVKPTPTLEELLEFPCDYIFKAFGPHGEAFVDAVRSAVCRTVPVPADCIKLRASRDSSYQCVTILTRLQHIDQLRAIYTDLQQVADLKYLL